jgi:hypothetical protein
MRKISPPRNLGRNGLARLQGEVASGRGKKLVEPGLRAPAGRAAQGIVNNYFFCPSNWKFLQSEINFIREHLILIIIYKNNAN